VKIAVISTIVGNVEQPQPWVMPTSSEHEVSVFRQQRSYHGMTAEISRRVAKADKMLAHCTTPEFDAYVWLDGSMRITQPELVDELVAYLGDHDAAFYVHPDRDCAYDEADYCIQEIKRGNAYLKRRYNPEHLALQTAHYREVGMPAHTGLHCGGLFIRRNNERANVLCQCWHDQLAWSTQDQVGLAYARYLVPEAKIRTIAGSIWEGACHRWCGHVNVIGQREAFL
jgi:hypothetical protein